MMLSDDKDKLGEQLSAYLDGELSETEAAEVEQFLAADSQARQMLEALRRTVEMVQTLPRRPAPDRLLEGLTARLEHEPDTASASALPRRGERRRSWGPWVRAAIVVFAVGGGFWAFRHVNESSVRKYDGEVPGFDTESVESGPRRLKSATLGESTEADARGPLNESIPDGLMSEAQEIYSGENPTMAGADAAAIAVLPQAALAGDVAEPLESKLRRGVLRGDVLNHPFHNETVRWSVLCTRVEDCDQAQNQITAFLTAHQIEPLEQVLVDDAAPVPASLPFVVAGQAHRNFGETPADHQFLVRLPASELDALIQEVGASPERRLSLGIRGHVVAADMNRVREALRSSVAGRAGPPAESSITVVIDLRVSPLESPGKER